MSKLVTFCQPSSLVLALTMAYSSLAQTPATFAPVMTYSTGTNSGPTDVAVADVNGDGKPDLLLADNNVASAGVLLGNGNGTFQSVVLYSTGQNSTPSKIAVGDVNKDGKPDLLFSDPNSNMVRVLLGTSTGAFPAVASYSTGVGGQRPGSLALADINGDGNLDVATGNLDSNSVSVLLGNGNGTFQDALIFSSGAARPVAIAAADVNADGRPDLLTVSTDANAISVLLSTTGGASLFVPAVRYSTGAGSSPIDLAVADVNSDGKLDVLTASRTLNAAGVLLGAGQGTFSAATSYTTATNSTPYSNPLDIAVADANGDGKADLLVANCNNDSTVGLLTGTGDGTFSTLTTYSAGPNTPRVYAIAVADVNGDGRPDAVTANIGNSTVGVLLNATTTPLAVAAPLPGSSAMLAPNPARFSPTLTVTGLPVQACRLEAKLYTAVGQMAYCLALPIAAGAAQAKIPTAGLPAGVYLLRLSAFDAHSTLGLLPIQRLLVE